MKSSDQYFDNIVKMSEIRKTNITQKDLKRYYKYGEEALKNLKPAIIEMKKWGDEIAPSIPPRDDLPDMYMRFGHWDDASRVLNECYKGLAIDKNDLEDRIKWINSCKQITLKTLSHIEENPGVLQKDMYKRLYDLDKESLKWTLRFYNGISKVKHKNTNMLYIKGLIL